MREQSLVPFLQKLGVLEVAILGRSDQLLSGFGF